MNLINYIFGSRTFGATRSSQWPTVQKNHLLKQPFCSVCGIRGNILNPLNVHHVKPFHDHPELELDEKNLISLCRIHHFFFGHLNNWSSYNDTVRTDSDMWRQKIANRPK